MRESGIVQSVHDNEALVMLKKRGACPGCMACSSNRDGYMVIKAVASDKLRAGDNVTVEIESSSLVKAILLVYILPTIAFVAGVLAGQEIAPLLGINQYKEFLSLSVGIMLLCASMLLARYYGISKKDTYQAKITEKI